MPCEVQLIAHQGQVSPPSPQNSPVVAQQQLLMQVVLHAVDPAVELGFVSSAPQAVHARLTAHQ